MSRSASPLGSWWLLSVRVFAAAVVVHRLASGALAATCAYVANGSDGTLTVIDAASNSVTDTISVGGNPTAVAATANGASVYVTDTLPDAVHVLSTSVGTVTDNIPLMECGAALCGPESLAIAVDGRAYVPSPIDDGSHVLSVINTATNSVSQTIMLQSGAAQRGGGVAVTHDGHSACASGYALKVTAGRPTHALLYVDVVDTSTKAVSPRTTDLGAITSVGDFLAVARTAAAVTAGEICYVADGFSGNVAVSEVAGNMPLTEIPLHSNLTGIAATADGQSAYVSGGTSASAPATLDEGQIFVIDTTTNSVSASIRVPGSFLTSVALSPDGTFALTTDRDGRRAFVINASSKRITASIPIGSGASGVAIASVAAGCPTRAPCVGDCNRDGVVTVDEMLRMVNSALKIPGTQACPVGDVNHDGQITVDEILGAAHNALRGCPAA